MLGEKMLSNGKIFVYGHPIGVDYYHIYNIHDILTTVLKLHLLSLYYLISEFTKVFIDPAPWKNSDPISSKSTLEKLCPFPLLPIYTSMIKLGEKNTIMLLLLLFFFGVI